MASPLLLHPRVLEFAAAVLGAGVLLDSFRIACFPPMPAAHRGEAVRAERPLRETCTPAFQAMRER